MAVLALPLILNMKAAAGILLMVVTLLLTQDEAVGNAGFSYDDFENWLATMRRTSSCPSDLQDENAECRAYSKPTYDSAQEEHSYFQERELAEQNVRRITVAKDGSGNFRSVQAAVNTVPDYNKQRVVIFIKRGVYREKVGISYYKPYITLQGEGSQLTFIEWNDNASKEMPNGQPLGTFGSASVAVDSNYFIAKDISFRNKAPPAPPGAVGRQAVALRISGDMATFYNVGFYGSQDTLYDHLGRHYFYGCYIEGSVDFILGNGRSLYKECRLNSQESLNGFITAQLRANPNENSGFSFVDCIVTGSGSIYLGRAWGAYSRVVFSTTYFARVITPEGWSDWGIPSHQKTVFYGEYNCRGPGAQREGRVKWSRQLSKAEAQPFLGIGFINGETWLPQM